MSAAAAPTDGATTPWALRASGLRKTYRTRRGRRAAVAGLDLAVPVGGVHGFLGPNGSGKTTTIRMALGLIRPDAGGIEVFGHRVPAELPRVIGRVGAIVEQPRFFPAFTAHQNLAVLARAVGTPTRRVGEVLEEVGLAARGRDRYRGFSLGMKQRLAIAATLLKDPDLFIFDEPTNGLDPAGIHEIRASMRRLAERGRTVLVSSHILSEVQQVADTVSIIGRGRLLAEGRVSDILAGTTGSSVRVGVPDPARAAAVLREAGFAVTPAGPHTLTVPLLRGPAEVDPSEITRVLAGRSIFVGELVAIQPDLEQVFLRLTAGDQLGAGGPR